MEVEGTIDQRLQRLFEQHDKVTVEMRTSAFIWALTKVCWKLDPKSQEFRDARDFTKRVGRYRFADQEYASCIACSGICMVSPRCCAWH